MQPARTAAAAAIKVQKKLYRKFGSVTRARPISIIVGSAGRFAAIFSFPLFSFFFFVFLYIYARARFPLSYPPAAIFGFRFFLSLPRDILYSTFFSPIRI